MSLTNIFKIKLQMTDGGSTNDYYFEISLYFISTHSNQCIQYLNSRYQNENLFFLFKILIKVYCG